MESRKSTIIRSLRFRLCVILTVIGSITAGIICSVSYNRSVSAVNDWCDEDLSQIASVIVNYDVILPHSWTRMPMSSYRHPSRHSMSGRHMPPPGFFDAPLLPIPSLNDLFEQHKDIIIAPLYPKEGEVFYFEKGSQDGFYTVTIGDKKVRAVVATNRAGIRFVVARPAELLDAYATNLMMVSVYDFLLLLLIYIPSVIVSVHILFIPVRRLAKELNERKESDMTPIESKALPSELDVFTDSINSLFTKTLKSLNAERRFIADATHEMRTPLTAISLQAQSLDENLMPKSEASKLKDLKAAISRQRQLTNDLLSYARLQCSGYEKKKDLFRAMDVFVDVIDSLGTLADDKDIDLGVVGECSEQLCTDRNAVRMILTNLVSNAIKYTQRGGVCDLLCKAGEDGVSLVVEDNGPGIRDEELELVCNAFYRVGGDTSAVEGTGLGLAIVKSTCDAIGAQLSLSNREEGGLRAEVFIKS